MSYYTGAGAYNVYNGQNNYQESTEQYHVANPVLNQGAGTSQNEGNNSGNKKSNRPFNSGKRNDGYGGYNGRAFARSRGVQMYSRGTANHAEVGEPSSSNFRSNRYGYRQDGGNSYSYNKYKNSYDDKANNYRSRENNYDAGENRVYGKYFNRSTNRNIDDGAYGTNEVFRGHRNWRANNISKKCKSPDKKKLDASSQRERLEQMLAQRTLECLVCCEKIKHTDKIWSCKQCYHILHLNCTIAWANSSKHENGWRCPACQNVCVNIPKQYTCYCSKTQEPRPLPGVVPHACGELCEKIRRGCAHRCTILCHPGPCPDCNVLVAKPCGCGATSQTIRCSSDTGIVCEGVCRKELECGLHKCEGKCHVGECLTCEQMLQQVCFCGKVGRKVKCSKELQGATNYSCGDICYKLLTCGNHRCQRVCHEGDCNPCDTDSALIQSCPCGKTKLEQQRTSCLDPISCCDKICDKPLTCGQPASPHICKSLCHPSPCPPCPLTTLIRCRCGHMDREIPCPQLTTKADDARCERKCTKKRLCGKHRCNQHCCIEVEHICPLPCHRFLSCGQHRCDRTCHSGRCLPCIETSFSELYCECGANVIYPPIPCGTRPPVCNEPCSRPRPCGHDVNHSCHTGPCPPCTVLCIRWCYGKHEQRAAIPCYQEDFSCGLACSKPLPCSRHRCDKSCHVGPCPQPCRQKCQVPRPQCGHPCEAPCHEGPCPETSCKQSVPVTCPCGLQKSSRACIELTDEYKELEMANLKDKMADIMKDQAVDISDIAKVKRPAILKTLDCTEECRVLERNRRLAIGLQIRNPDLSQKLTPRYSDFMRNWAKKDPQFCQKVHDKLTELVHLAKQSKQKSRSHSFESMNRDKRHFLHEYCEHFGCESAAYDQEPNRNVVATAFREKSWLPSLSLLEFIQRENGQRKVPGPVLGKGLVGKSEIVALKLPGRVQRAQTPPGETIDYFDNPPV